MRVLWIGIVLIVLVATVASLWGVGYLALRPIDPNFTSVAGPVITGGSMSLETVVKSTIVPAVLRNVETGQDSDFVLAGTYVETQGAIVGVQGGVFSEEFTGVRAVPLEGYVVRPGDQVTVAAVFTLPYKGKHQLTHIYLTYTVFGIRHRIRLPWKLGACVSDSTDNAPPCDALAPATP